MSRQKKSSLSVGRDCGVILVEKIEIEKRTERSQHKLVCALDP